MSMATSQYRHNIHKKNIFYIYQTPSTAEPACKSCLDDANVAADLGKHLSGGADWTRHRPILGI